MNARIRIAAPLMLATTAALAATGYVGTQPPLESSVTHPYVAPGTQPAIAEPATPPSAQVAQPVEAPAIATPAPEYRPHSAVTVTAPRPSDDELLRNAVMDRLSTDPRLSGRIGVESFRHVVSLTGRVTTRAQIDRAETLARGVEGVRDVENRLTSRVGMI
jgi:hypothetical protein